MKQSGRTTRRINNYIEELFQKGIITDIKDHDVAGEIDKRTGITLTGEHQDFFNSLVFDKIKRRLRKEHVEYVITPTGILRRAIRIYTSPTRLEIRLYK